MTSSNFDDYLTKRLQDPDVRAGYEATETEVQNLMMNDRGEWVVATPLRGSWWVRLELWWRNRKG